MRARPILFQPDMAKALWEGRKTQTRRAMKPQPPDWCKTAGYSCLTPKGHIEFRGRFVDCTGEDHGPACKFFKLRYGMPGDLLWVRETWVHTEAGIWTVSDAMRWPFRSQVAYRADGENPGDQWFPSIHMPRWASRMTLRLTGVRVEELQKISEQDALAEGAMEYPEKGCPEARPRHAFSMLWKRINGPESWNANPFVWVLAFDVIKENVDSVLREQAA